MNIRKIIGVLLFINLAQITLVLGMLIDKGDIGLKGMSAPIYIVIGLALANGVATVMGIVYANKLRNKNLLESMKNLEDLNAVLRAQRHDYLNHLQVVYGLIQLE